MGTPVTPREMGKLKMALTKLTEGELGKVRALVDCFSTMHRQGYDNISALVPKVETLARLKPKRKAKR